MFLEELVPLDALIAVRKGGNFRGSTENGGLSTLPTQAACSYTSTRRVTASL